MASSTLQKLKWRFQRRGSSDAAEEVNGGTAPPVTSASAQQIQQNLPIALNDVGQLATNTTNGQPQASISTPNAPTASEASSGLSTTTGDNPASAANETSITNEIFIANVSAPGDALDNNDGLNNVTRLFLRRSPAGFHVTNVPMFMQSSLIAPRSQHIAK
tara:strand:- start:2519 stop:3001 length:483 start_codon:yes stop_codon:yes gene_type:complete